MTPAFQFYPADWLADAKTAMASLEEEGAFIRLLCYAWREGSIPADARRCAALIGKGATEELARVVQVWFNQHPTDCTKLVHPRLEREREKQERWREKSAEGGKKSAEKRLTNRVKESIQRVVEPPYQPNGNSSSSSSTSVLPQSPSAPASPPLGNGKKEKDVIPKTPEALAICELFNRRPSTEWDPKLVRKFKDGVRRGVVTLASIEKISAYYSSERSKGEEGRHRRDIGTFVNNFDGELDRAEAFLMSQNRNGHAAVKPPATDDLWLPFLECINRPAEFEFHRAPGFLLKQFETWKTSNPIQ